MGETEQMAQMSKNDFNSPNHKDEKSKVKDIREDDVYQALLEQLVVCTTSAEARILTEICVNLCNLKHIWGFKAVVKKKFNITL